MKNIKLFLFAIIFGIITGCSCIGQVPTQYAYVDENCNAILPDYTETIVIKDNCEVTLITQMPVPGTTISATTTVEITAFDAATNWSSVVFNVVILDTIPPTIQLDSTWSYTDREVGDMFRTIFGWVQIKGIEFNSVLPFEEYPMSMIDSMKVFTCTIPIPAERHREWWWGVNYPEL